MQLNYSFEHESLFNYCSQKGSIKNEIEVVAPHVGTNQSQNKISHSHATTSHAFEISQKLKSSPQLPLVTSLKMSLRNTQSTIFFFWKHSRLYLNVLKNWQLGPRVEN